ncbi:MAG: ATP-binding protein [Ignavibacteriales bacterium]|nr:ATP-binding protein [Ignavibacteriales bacterium]
MSERKIGKVISVDSFRVVVQLDEDLKSLYKSGFNDIYEIARINSYLIIPVGADRIVAIVTRVKIQDETEIEKTSGFITLPKAHRYLVATMIGTIENGKDYLQGVYNYPILDNPVWYVVKGDLDKIFDTAVKEGIDYTKDFYLPIGTSPAFSDYHIRINPDRFFGKHAAILGNTGSGKSCTVASILQSLFSFSDKDGKHLQNAHFIVFDTNGEYKRAFIGDGKGNDYKDKILVNAICIDKEGIKVPFWFMNYDDFEFLFEPSANTQSPILKRAISFAKNETNALSSDSIPQYYYNRLVEIVHLAKTADQMKLKPIVFHDIQGIATYLKALNIGFDFNPILQSLAKLVKNGGNALTPGEKGWINGHLQQNILFDVSNELANELRKLSVYISSKKILQDKNIDLPLYFNYDKMISTFIDEAINENESSNNRIREFVSTLRLRLQAYLNDERISEPLLLNQTTNINESLSKFLAFILGDFFKILNKTEPDIYTKYFKEQVEKTEPEKVDSEKPNQITIIDMSLIPYEVLETITGLIGRLILEFLSRFNNEQRGDFPIVIVLEEAQNYIPEKDRGEKVSISKKVFERVAREGRKFGLSLVVSSQRPSELSKTVLSQCNSFIVHRLQNPDDQKYVKQLVSAANEDILQQLPILPQQVAVIMGDGVRTPVQMRVNTAAPKPNSDNPKFVGKWLKGIDKTFPDYKGITKNWEDGKRGN